MDAELDQLASASSQAQSLADRVARFHGNPYKALLALLRNPSIPTVEMSRVAGVDDNTVYRWRVEVEGFKDTMDAIRTASANLRHEYARAALEESIPDVADMMVGRAKSLTHKDGQRAGERILEATGVLPKQGQEARVPIQVTTRTYILIQPGQEPQTFMVEKAEPKQLPEPSS